MKDAKRKQRLYAIVVAGLDHDNIVFSIPFSQAIFTRRYQAVKALRADMTARVKARADFAILHGIDPSEAIRESKRHHRGTLELATFERIS